MLAAGADYAMAFAGWISTLGTRMLEQYDQQLDNAWEPFLSDDDGSGYWAPGTSHAQRTVA